MPLVTHPLFIEDRSANNSEAKRGSMLKRVIGVKNLGDRPAEVDLWIVATDPASEPLLRWCRFSDRNPLRLEARESREVTLTFDIPQQATPGLYPYEVLVDAQAQYPDKPPLRRPQQLRVLPSTHDAEWGTDPVFSVQPVTQAAHPHSLHPGEMLEVTVQVKNCSKRVDRFYLSCPELPQDWFTVRYPESSLDIPGLVRETDGLELNPDSSGTILLHLHPPPYTPAGHYFPTLRLTSSNDDTLQLLDVVYLQVLVSDRLDLDLQPTLQRIPDEPGQFHLQVTNQGNIVRRLIVEAADGDRLFRYGIDPFVLCLEPGATEPLVIQAQPKRGWRRPWWGKGRECPFEIYLEEVAGEGPSPGFPSTTAQGTLLWQARPWWMLALLMLSALGMVGAIAFLLWLLFLKPPAPPPQPQIIAASPTLEPGAAGSRPPEANAEEPIRLNWTISRLRDIDRITIIQRERGTEVNRKTYTFGGRIPEALQGRSQTQGFCEAVETDTEAQLRCQAIPVAPATAGTHTFQLEVFSTHDGEEPADTHMTDSLAIAPTPQPTIVQFSPSATTYQIPGVESPEGAIPPPIRLNWEISNPDQVQEVQIIGTTQDGSLPNALQRYSLTDGIPTALQGFCTLAQRLVCRDVPTAATQPGTYAFQLTLIPTSSDQETTRQAPPVRIQPPSPTLQGFQINGEDVGQAPSVPIELNPNEPTTVTLSWQVEAGPGSQVEILPAPGTVPATGSLEYTLSPESGQHPLTLRIVTPSGEQLTRTILLEPILPAPEPPLPPVNPSPPTTPPSPSPKPLITPLPDSNTSY